MDSAKLCAVAVIAVACFAVIKQLSGGMLPSVRAVIGVVFAVALLASAAPVLEYVELLFKETGFEKYAVPIMKGGGIAILSHGCAAVCRDSGEAAMAECVEASGKLEIFLICIPLISEIFSFAVKLMGR
jgi:stage III sporulation protein AD